MVPNLSAIGKICLIYAIDFHSAVDYLSKEEPLLKSSAIRAIIKLTVLSLRHHARPNNCSKKENYAATMKAAVVALLFHDLEGG